jgi:predicted DsbA family dithiol-disulfide isomerase
VDGTSADDAAAELRLVRELMGGAGPNIRLPRIVANSHLALEAAEYARDHGLFDAFHRSVFAAYFGQGLNIGQPAVLGALGIAVGLEARELVAAAREHRYHDRLERVQQDKRWYGLYGTPTFIIANQRIAGAEPYTVVRRALQRIGAPSAPSRHLARGRPTGTREHPEDTHP